MIRSRIRIFAVLVALVMVVAACGGDDDATGEESTTTTAAIETTTTAAAPETTTTAAAATTTTAAAADALVIWADETRAQVLGPITDAFTADTGIPVSVELVVFGDIRNNVQTAAPAGEGPDIFVGAHDWIGELQANGILGEVDLAGRESEFYPVTIDAFSLGGTLYGLPYAIENLGLYYNTDLVPEPPTTWEELTSICDGLTDLTVCIAAPARDAFANQAFIQGFGGYIFDYTATGFDAANVGLDNEGAVTGATWLDSAVKDGYLSTDVDWSNMNDIFGNGQAAFLWNGPWHLSDIRDSGVPYGVTTFPTIDGNQPIPFVGVQGFMISAFSDQQVAAQLFLTDYVATEEAMVALFEAGLRGPAMTSAYEAALAADPEVGAFSAVDADPGLLMPNIPEMSAVWGAMGDAFTVIYNQAYEGAVSDPAAVMANAAETVRSAIAG